jgi:hypothetical protein
VPDPTVASHTVPDGLSTAVASISAELSEANHARETALPACRRVIRSAGVGNGAPAMNDIVKRASAYSFSASCRKPAWATAGWGASTSCASRSDASASAVS